MTLPTETAPEKKVNWDRLDVEIQHKGRAITLPGDPANMPTEKAIEALQRKLADDNQVFDVHELIEAYHLDAAVAFVKAMAKLYGWASPQSTPGFFGPTPPTMISVRVGFRDDEVVQCPLGAFKLPGVDSLIQTAFTGDNKGRPVFVIYGKVKKKDKHLLVELAMETRRIVKEESIYRGKAIRIGVNEDGSLDMHEPPTFLDVSAKDELIFDHDIQDQIDTNVMVPICNTAEVRANRIPLKRTILLEGPYGTGKSLLARNAARVCEANGWTFILLDKVQGLKTALEFGLRYSPAVVFAEDIDRVASERDEDANDLINMIDGVLSKRSEIMTILTTNFADKLDKAMIRPGRLDAVISLRAPSDEAVARLLKAYAGNLLLEGEEVTGAARELSGQIPASIRECVERAKLGMIGRKATTLADKDLVVAAQTMKNHLALLNKEVASKTEAEVLAESLRAVILNGRGDKIDLVPDVRDMTKRIAHEMGI